MLFLNKVCSFRKVLTSFKFYHSSPALHKIVSFNLSDIGEGIREVTVRDWFVKVGDKVSQFENVCLVESDKASVSITSRFDGTVKKLYYNVGDVALVGEPLLDIDLEESAEELYVPKGALVSNDPSPVKSPALFSPVESSVKTTENELYTNKALATPAVRRIAKEKNINLELVNATGKGGRILKEDILQYLSEITTTKNADSHPNQDKWMEITGIKKTMVRTMTKSNSIPTFGYCDEIDLSNLIDLRNTVREFGAKKGINITYMPFFIKALSKALEEYPELNACVDDKCEQIIFKSQHNIGIAMDTEKGLIVPNIKNVQSLSVLDLTIELKRLLELGRSNQLGPSDMSGGTITISNIGIIGGTYLRPLILPPEVCILSLGRVKIVPAFNEKDEVIKKYVLNASWAADHRVVDGATIAKFSNVWKGLIENPNYLLINA